MVDPTRTIPRQRTAIHRGDFSRPTKCALRDGLIDTSVSVFDFGCGHGRDVELLRENGITSNGWDPAFFPEHPHRSSEVVNLGYVINVIESSDERAETLRRAWELCQRVLVVSAQVHLSGRGQTQVEFGDGVLTSRGTFQKFFQQVELKTYIESVLESEAIPADIGVYYVFKDKVAEQQFLASRHRRAAAAPRKRISEIRFDENRELLEPFMATIAALGRLPEPDEFPQAAEIESRFGSVKRAFALVKRVTRTEEWDAITQRCTEDLLVYLALGRFRRRPPMSILPLGLQRDLRAFFGSYSNACRLADEVLFQAGKPELVDEACRKSAVGKLLRNALYVHRSALEGLSPLLRVYEGCARAYLGEIDGANLIKVHRQSGKVSYLVYPDFETDPHPALVRSVKLSLRTREIDCLEYNASANPPILHRKETFLADDHPLYPKFARLTQQEEKHGLLDDTATIGTRDGWEARLGALGFGLRGHRLVRI
jgi:DNA phosphorothioation-associated putative methyltransferase